MAPRLTAGLAFCLCCAAAQAETTAPLSAIDWLSNSIAQDAVPQEGAVAGPSASVPVEVRVLPLDKAVTDSAGLIDAAKLNLPQDIWGRSSAGDLTNALNRVELDADAPASISKFLRDLLQARLDPPIDAAVNDRFFFARVDRLLEKGHLDLARDLMDAAMIDDPQVFRRQFDIALLTGNETEACRQVESTPDLSPTYPARIFCLMRLGQFDVAALTLGNAETLGILPEADDALLRHFLDPELFEGEPLPAPPRFPTPLQFRLYEAIGERISTEGLPLPFAFADMSMDVGWKARLTAAERLAANGVIPFTRLLEVYSERGPSASGGVWERIRAVTRFAEAVERGDGAELESKLPAAWAAARQAGYTAAFAAWLQPHLSLLSAGRASHAAFEISLLAGDATAASRFANASVADQFLLSIAEDRAGTALAGDAFGRAVLRGLAAVNAGGTYEALISDDRRGEALLRALDQLADGATGNPETTAQSLAALRKIGLHDLARQIAIEVILKEGEA
ncbi:MAG: hypothetical protein AAFR73_02205 [Pseudomonadota bacterium]